jgi:hypothetical protein
MVHCALKELSAGETVMLATETETERDPEPIRRRRKKAKIQIFAPVGHLNTFVTYLQ